MSNKNQSSYYAKRAGEHDFDFNECKNLGEFHDRRHQKEANSSKTSHHKEFEGKISNTRDNQGMQLGSFLVCLIDVSIGTFKGRNQKAIGRYV